MFEFIELCQVFFSIFHCILYENKIKNKQYVLSLFDIFLIQQYITIHIFETRNKIVKVLDICYNITTVNSNNKVCTSFDVHNCQFSC